MRVREHWMLHAKIDVAPLHHVSLFGSYLGPGLEISELDHCDRLSRLPAESDDTGRATEGFLPTLPQSNHLAARMDVALANPTAIRPGAHSPLPGGVGQTSSYNQQDWKDDFLGCALHGNDSGCRQAPCRSPGMPLDNWCPGPESNRYGGEPPKDFKSFASTNFATQANLTAQRVGVLWPRSAKCSRYNTFQTKLSIGPQAATGIHEGARRTKKEIHEGTRRTTKGHEEGLPSFNDKPRRNPSAIL